MIETADFREEPIADYRIGQLIVWPSDRYYYNNC